MTTDTAYQTTKKMPAGVNGEFVFTILDPDQVAIAGSSIDSITLSLKTEAGATINSRAGTTDPAANVTIDSNGVLTWLIQQADSAIQDSSIEVGNREVHLAIFEWEYGTPAKKGTLKLFLECVKLS